MSDRTIFIGDLHGAYNEAYALLEKLQLTITDHVVFLGDLVDRGSENGKCVDLVRHREQVQGKIACILGNHEDQHIIYEERRRHTGRLPEMPPSHTATREQLKPEHYEWFQRLPLWVRVQEHNVVAIHAGMFPGRPVELQKTRHLLHAQMLNPFMGVDAPPNERSLWPSKVPRGEENDWKFWTAFYNQPETVVFGHTVLDRPLITEKCVGIDGGAVFGHDLHAYVLPEKVIVSVKATTDYGYGRDRNKSHGRTVNKYEVHEGVFAFS